MTLSQPDPAVLSDLLKRVEAATGPDRLLDYAIDNCLFNGEVPALTDIEIAKGADEMGGVWPNGSQPGRYTASIDAALALVEKVLPSANTVGFERTPSRHPCSGYVSRNYVSDGSHFQFEAEAATTPLAIILALLRALHSLPQDGGGKT